MPRTVAPSVKTLAQNIWVKAWNAEKPLTFNCGSEAECHRMAFTLYNSVRHVRKAGPDDPGIPRVLWEAVHGLTIRREGATLTLTKATDTPIARLMAQALGEEGVRELPTDVDLAADEAAKRLAERISQGIAQGAGGAEAVEKAVRATPYYTREK